jgi:hypothetical protein
MKNHPILEMTPENRKKLNKFILSKLKTIDPIVVKGTFGEGEVYITKASIEVKPWSIDLYVKVKYVEKVSSDRSWLSKNTLGRRRNDKIKDTIVWNQNSTVKIIAKPFGVGNITVESVTVKK